MQMLRKYSYRRMLLFASAFFTALSAFAGSGGSGTVRAMAVLDGSLHQIKVDSSRTVEDSAFFNPSYIGNIDSAYTVQNVVSLMMNESSVLYLRSAFTATVQVRISYTGPTGDTASVIRYLTVNYDSAHTYHSRSSFVFYGAHKVTVKVLSVDLHGTVSWDPTTVLVLENQLVTRPDFSFSCSSTVTDITVSSVADTADEVPVSWTTVLGADQYDLEWTYVDKSALSKYMVGGSPSPALIFLNNATRVSTSGTTYNIPLIYDDSGTLFIRVRPVQLGAANSVTAAIWSSDAGSPVLGQYVFKGHERPLNWQSNISYAEEGKRKVVLQYYDGSLRSRQTVTKDNTTNTTIVGETYYDYQGRPTIQVMPSPTLNNIIKYTAGFNVSINGAEYSQSNYDTLPDPGAYCDAHADSMSNASGASLYYSRNNPVRTAGMNQFIPDAHDYPFTETEYTPDNTGRISRQGGVDSLYQLGRGHETKYYYGTPDQHELDALFGTEVGDRSHYFKNMVRDANGQYSVSYVDMHGRTIATALAGAAPPGMSALASNTSDSITETLADPKSALVQGLSMVSQKSLLVPAMGAYAFNYSLTPSILHELNCQSTDICYTCRYDLEVSITDNCNNQLLPGHKAFDTVVHNFKLDSITQTCTPSTMGLNFTLTLPEGSYIVTKKLTANQDAYNYYRDSVYLPGNTCSSMQQYINTQRAITAAANTQCAPNCAACLDSVGTWDQFWAKYISQGGLQPSDTAAYRQEALTAYNNALSSCSVLCNNSISQDNDILNAMLQDVTPPFGQYADTSLNIHADKYSIFYIPTGDTSSRFPLFKSTSIHYLDENGNPDSVYNQQSDLMVEPNSLTMSQFVQNFRASWANALLPYHPEYCKLQALQAQRPSNLWDRRMEAIDNYEDAYNQGFLNPTGNSSAPYSKFHIETANIDPLSAESTHLRDLLRAKLAIYQKAVSVNPNLSMWSLACVMVECKGDDRACILHYSSVANDFDTTVMCQGDLDMAWRNFRQFYLGAKQDILDQEIIEKHAGCAPPALLAYNKVPAAADLYSAKHQPEFSDMTTSLSRSNLKDLAGVSSPTAATHQQAIAQDSLNSFYTQNCNAFARQWASQLSPCQYDPSDLNTIILPRLVALCRLACDSAHPYGASSLPAGVTSGGFSSFQDILNDYNHTHPVTDTLRCNVELITSPLPYDRQPVYSGKAVFSRPSNCECALINDQYNIYTLSGHGDVSFSAYLLRTQQVNISDADLAQLRNMCKNTTNTATCTYLSKPIYLPPSMQCYSGPACSSCTTVDSLYRLYKIQFPRDTPSITTDADTLQAQKNILFQNFMNNRLGFSKQAWEYLQFMDTCAVHSADTANSTQCLAKTIAHLFKSGTGNQMTDLRATPDSGYIMVGSKSGGYGGTDAFMVRTDRGGNVQWAKAYGGTLNDNFSKVKFTSDGGFIAIGTTMSAKDPAGDMFIVKTNASGTTQWTKTIGFNTDYGERGVNIIQTSDGGYAAVGMYDFVNGDVNFLAAKLDSSGAVKWVNDFGTETSDDVSDLTEHGDTLVVTGYSYDETSRYYGVLIKLNEHDSGRVLSKTYYKDVQTSNMSTYLSSIYPSSGGYLIFTLSALNFASDSASLGALRVGFDGSIQSYTRFNFPGPDPHTNPANAIALIPTLDGGYLSAQTGLSTSHIFLQKASSSETLQWSREIVFPGSQSLGWLLQNPDSTYTTIGTENSFLSLFTVSSAGTVGCYDSTSSLSLTHPPLVITLGNSITDQLLTPTRTDTTLNETYLTLMDSTLTCSSGHDTCYTINNGPMLCGKALPVLPPLAVDSVTTCSDSTFFSVSKGTELYKVYSDSLKGNFEQLYLSSCMQAYKYENFTVRHIQSEYHYTLYYYDQAGNLVKTIPPAGVHQNTDTAWLSSVRAARATGSTVVPAHTLETDYRYNTLNQVVSQYSPDGRLSNFWYDRLGRLSLSQNARQYPNDQYSYTQYDSIGRIVQVGQLVSSTAITDTVSRTESTLATWENNAASTADQITATSYDVDYSGIALELSPRNLRNRVAWTALFNTAADLANGNPNASAATYYSYDILGNVDTLVQDYGNGHMYSDVGNVMNINGNRFKKLVYDFDLVSGKVNQVSYQHGFPDAFYHSYIYDAENRITNVMSSKDSISWDNDAFYRYYAHGPLARTILGQQQVQGINYAYTLQGWLKAINPAPYTGGAFTLRPDSSSNIVAGSAYNLLLNYFDGDYTPISGVAGPDSAVHTTLSGDYRPLFNGNISSMGVNVRGLSSPLLYNYQYDQLNRLIHMDAWKRTSTPWSAITKIPDFQESIAYDPNGNIQKYKRNGNNTFTSQPIGMDSLNYAYIPGTNRLDHIRDSVPSGNYTTDIDDQSSGNYTYDSTGNLVSDNASGISNISWTVYGKIASIARGDTTIRYVYDAGGNRIGKSVIHSGDTLTTWYVRDAQGNVLTVYTAGDPALRGRDLTRSELHIYGSSRLGILKDSTDVQMLARPDTASIPLLGLADSVTFTRGNKLFELTNHLGNVLATISDKRYGVSTDDSTVSYFIPEVVSANDYYPFGSPQPGRFYTESGVGTYRYGFNGKENDNEVKGDGDQIDYGMRVYDPRIGRFLSVDPITARYPQLTPYQFASNRPIDGIDIDGKEWATQTNAAIDWTTGSARLITTNYVKVKVINESKIIRDPDIIKAKAELFAKSIESKLTNIQIPLRLPDESINTKVILDYTPPSADDLPTIGKLTFDDRVTTRKTSIISRNGVTTTSTEIGSTPGETKGAITSFNIHIGITMDGKVVSDEDFATTAQHEGFHSAGGNHPWALTKIELQYSAEVNQNDPILLDSRTDLIKNNKMNSAENPNPRFRSNSGSILTPGQVKAVTEKIKTSPYTTSDLGVKDN